MLQWIINYRDFNKSAIRLRETMLTLGNGYFASRGCHEDALSPLHYAGTYLAGVYNRAVSNIAGKELINEDLVNCPNWLPISFKIEGEDWWDIHQVEICSYRELLHLKHGLSLRTIVCKDHKKRCFTIKSLRFVSQDNKHIAGIRYTITCSNWSGKIIIRSSLFGDVYNKGVPRYQELNNQHLEMIAKGHFSKNCLFLKAKTNHSEIVISETVKTEIYKNKKKLNCSYEILEEDKNIHQLFKLELKPFEQVVVNKYVCIYHSKDYAICESLNDAKKCILSLPSLKQLIKNHKRAWKQLWDQSDIELDSSDKKEQKLVRLHIFHTLQSVSKHSKTIDYGIPARGLHGEAYRGHVYWDEVYILPFFIYQYPDVARAMLLYRYNRLEAAKALAQKKGFQGAMFPWQSASNGEEESQQIHLNPRSATWGPDYSSNQRHVNLAIVYNIWHYYQMTKDISFMVDYGAEMIFEIAIFLTSLCIYNSKEDRFEIHGVMGPDEYHERYPHTEIPGLNNNSYTNILSVWALEKAIEVTKILSKKRLQELFDNLSISQTDISHWKQIALKMFIPFHNHVISQFEGYEHLEPFDWKSYQKKYSNIERLDRILKAEGLDPNAYQIAKQADTLMLYYLLSDQEISKIVKQLGYEYSEKTKPDLIRYYMQRTSHGSTLSKITCASLLLSHDPMGAKTLYHEALQSDIEDTQGGTAEEGIHLGVMAASVSFLIKNFSGLCIKEDMLCLNPALPPWVSRLKFKMVFMKNLLEIEMTSKACCVSLIEDYHPYSWIIIGDKKYQLKLGEPFLCNTTSS